MSSAVDFVRNFQPTKQLLPSSGKLKREVSMEEIFQVLELETFFVQNCLTNVPSSTVNR